jgi:hypothetical protein
MTDRELAPALADNTPVHDTSTIAGWGVDADTRNDPTYPYRQREREDGHGAPTRWVRPAEQRGDTEVLQSIEYRHRPAVYGSALPPQGLSGAMRRAAFRWSESNLLHWLILMGADRVNVVEGLASDLAQGRVPNIPAEMGMAAGWKHDRKAVLTKAAVTLVMVGGALAIGRRALGRN